MDLGSQNPASLNYGHHFTVSKNSYSSPGVKSKISVILFCARQFRQRSPFENQLVEGPKEISN